MTTQEETYHAGDPVIHLQTRKLLGTLIKGTTFNEHRTELRIRVAGLPNVPPFTPADAMREAVDATYYIAWLRPAFHTESVRALWLSTDASPALFARHLYRPVTKPDDHELLKVGDAARVVLERMGDRDVMLDQTREYLKYLVRRGDSYRKHLEEKG